MLQLLIIAALLGQSDAYVKLEGRLLRNFTYQLSSEPSPSRRFLLTGGKWTSEKGDHTVRFVDFRVRRDRTTDVILIEDEKWFHWVTFYPKIREPSYLYLGEVEFLRFQGDEDIVYRRIPQTPIDCPPHMLVEICYLG